MRPTRPCSSLRCAQARSCCRQHTLAPTASDWRLIHGYYAALASHSPTTNVRREDICNGGGHPWLTTPHTHLSVLRHDSAGSNVRTNFAQFQMTHMADFAIADSSRLRWRPGPFIDAIITDRTRRRANSPSSSMTAELMVSKLECTAFGLMCREQRRTACGRAHVSWRRVATVHHTALRRHCCSCLV